MCEGANIEMTDGDGHTALLRALKDHDNELAWALIEAGADVNAKGAVRSENSAAPSCNSIF